jgi:hypothetical protein
MIPEDEEIKCRVCENEYKTKDLALHSYVCFKKFKWAKKILHLNEQLLNIHFEDNIEIFNNNELDILFDGNNNKDCMTYEGESLILEQIQVINHYIV